MSCFRLALMLFISAVVTLINISCIKADYEPIQGSEENINFEIMKTEPHSLDRDIDGPRSIPFSESDYDHDIRGDKQENLEENIFESQRRSVLPLARRLENQPEPKLMSYQALQNNPNNMRPVQLKEWVPKVPYEPVKANALSKARRVSEIEDAMSERYIMALNSILKRNAVRLQNEMILRDAILRAMLQPPSNLYNDVLGDSDGAAEGKATAYYNNGNQYNSNPYVQKYQKMKLDEMLKTRQVHPLNKFRGVSVTGDRRFWAPTSMNSLFERRERERMLLNRKRNIYFMRKNFMDAVKRYNYLRKMYQRSFLERQAKLRMAQFRNRAYHSNQMVQPAATKRPMLRKDTSLPRQANNFAHPRRENNYVHPGHENNYVHPGHKDNYAHPGHKSNYAHPGHENNYAHLGHENNYVHPGHENTYPQPHQKMNQKNQLYRPAINKIKNGKYPERKKFINQTQALSRINTAQLIASALKRVHSKLSTLKYGQDRSEKNGPNLMKMQMLIKELNKNRGHQKLERFNPGMRPIDKSLKAKDKIKIDEIPLTRSLPGPSNMQAMISKKSLSIPIGRGVMNRSLKPNNKIKIKEVPITGSQPSLINMNVMTPHKLAPLSFNIARGRVNGSLKPKQNIIIDNVPLTRSLSKLNEIRDPTRYDAAPSSLNKPIEGVIVTRSHITNNKPKIGKVSTTRTLSGLDTMKVMVHHEAYPTPHSTPKQSETIYRSLKTDNKSKINKIPVTRSLSSTNNTKALMHKEAASTSQNMHGREGGIKKSPKSKDKIHVNQVPLVRSLSSLNKMKAILRHETAPALLDIPKGSGNVNLKLIPIGQSTTKCRSLNEDDHNIVLDVPQLEDLKTDDDISCQDTLPMSSPRGDEEASAKNFTTDDNVNKMALDESKDSATAQNLLFTKLPNIRSMQPIKNTTLPIEVMRETTNRFGNDKMLFKSRNGNAAKTNSSKRLINRVISVHSKIRPLTSKDIYPKMDYSSLKAKNNSKSVPNEEVRGLKFEPQKQYPISQMVKAKERNKILTTRKDLEATNLQTKASASYIPKANKSDNQQKKSDQMATKGGYQQKDTTKELFRPNNVRIISKAPLTKADSISSELTSKVLLLRRGSYQGEKQRIGNYTGSHAEAATKSNVEIIPHPQLEKTKQDVNISVNATSGTQKPVMDDKTKNKNVGFKTTQVLNQAVIPTTVQWNVVNTSKAFRNLNGHFREYTKEPSEIQLQAKLVKQSSSHPSGNSLTSSSSHSSTPSSGTVVGSIRNNKHGANPKHQNNKGEFFTSHITPSVGAALKRADSNNKNKNMAVLGSKRSNEYDGRNKDQDQTNKYLNPKMNALDNDRNATVRYGIPVEGIEGHLVSSSETDDLHDPSAVVAPVLGSKLSNEQNSLEDGDETKTPDSQNQNKVKVEDTIKTPAIGSEEEKLLQLKGEFEGAEAADASAAPGSESKESPGHKELDEMSDSKTLGTADHNTVNTYDDTRNVPDQAVEEKNLINIENQFESKESDGVDSNGDNSTDINNNASDSQPMSSGKDESDNQGAAVTMIDVPNSENVPSASYFEDLEDLSDEVTDVLPKIEETPDDELNLKTNLNHGIDNPNLSAHHHRHHHHQHKHHHQRHHGHNSGTRKHKVSYWHPLRHHKKFHRHRDTVQ